jgi:hypothetical protein
VAANGRGMGVVETPASGPKAVLRAAAAGLVAALVGGIVWGLIVKWTQYELGFVAWGIGFIVGTAVVYGARNLRGIPFQLVAVVFALLGIVLGKYLGFVWVGQDELEKVGIDLPLFSKDTFDLFWEARKDVWGWWDLLWVGLAVVTAFRIPQHEPEPEPAQSHEPRPEHKPEGPAATDH